MHACTCIHNEELKMQVNTDQNTCSSYLNKLTRYTSLNAVQHANLISNITCTGNVLPVQVTYLYNVYKLYISDVVLEARPWPQCA